MTSIQFVVHPLPGTQEQLQEKLREVADRLNKYNTSGTPPRIFNYPDPDRIRIGSGFNRVSGSGSRRAKMTY
jgi:hypothetical protein